MQRFFALTLLLASPVVAAFEYEIEKPVLETASTPGHESLTSLAIDCLNQKSSADTRPTACLSGQGKIEAYRSEQRFTVPAISSKSITAEEMMDASSWPDDPTRLGSYFGAVINLFQMCESFWAFLGIDAHYENISGGLACNSHFGQLQFFHAQASATGESYLSTRNKILAWIRFNYEVIRDERLLSRAYCDYFNELKQDE